VKITRTTWLILALGVFVIAFAGLYMVYSRQASQQKDLKSSLAEAEAAYPQLTSQIQTLQGQLAQRQSDLAAELSKLSQAKAKFPASVQRIDYYQRLLAIADDCDLNVMSLTASQPRQENVDSVTYLVTTFNVAVRGEVANMLDFVHTLATSQYFTNATVTVVSINIPEPPTGQGGTLQKPQASISLNIYGYPGE
jgi:hypothetical protein